MNWETFTGRWGVYVNAPLQVPMELDQLLRLYAALDPKNVLEIGTWFGGTLHYWLKWCSPGAQVIGVDVDTGLLPESVRHHPEHRGRLELVQGGSDWPMTIAKVDALRAGQPLDFLFIDGCHINRLPIIDFDTYSPKVRPGGLVAFHDVISATLPVKDYWKELCARGLKTHTITDGSPESMGIGIVQM